MKHFGSRLINWYNRNKRDLPWRDVKDPYKIWLSEIILQQTRIDQGLDYYRRFVEKYPNVYKLAAADEKEVFKLWQGLGYYNRAENMLTTAKTIVEKHNGKFPESRDKLINFKGIGAYTSAAIASMAFEEPVPVVDGNVYRVISRIFGIKTPVNTAAARIQFDSVIQNLMDKLPPGTFNQALMEFGALHCKPRNPDCEECIFRTECYAFQNLLVTELPVKKAKAPVISRFFYYFILQLNRANTSLLYIKKREKNDIWKNLYEFPMIESTTKEDPLEIIPKYFSEVNVKRNEIDILSISKEYKHLLSHQKIHAQFIRLNVNKKIKNADDKSLLLIDKKKLKTYPVPRLIDRYLKEQKMII